MAIMYLVLACASLLIVYDFRTNEVPNIVVYPLILLGLYFNWPGTFPIWIASFLMILSAQLVGDQGIGMGDIKLWLAYFWAIPPGYVEQGVYLGFAVMFGSSLLQIVIRRAKKKFNVRPAAWRVFIACLFCVASIQLGWIV